MEAVLWYVLTGTRGGPNRARILRALHARPRNPNKLANDLDLDYKTVRHHLDVLVDNGIVSASGDEYGAVYLPSERVRQQWETVETVLVAAEESTDDESESDTDDGVNTNE
ncbi:ArsR/SmtB family transcription factor [Halomarina rubra]|uniref:ArsR/SmtB family transcription factor n=1 Tax=Halomarina rubra TaxID=2071873 RepID=A0ABD6B050_9EURY|nr:winged helix-turn-helix domain-containing protein [Halomarina rubra]